jgi:MerR family transcriptional regulator/heat shock protein HspR
MISAVAERYDIHPQTLRLYEREGLLDPPRSKGNTRLYDEPSLKRLESILTLTRDMGVNLAGVEVILRLQDELDRLKEERDQAVREMQRHFQTGTSVHRTHALVRITRGPLVPIDDASDDES